MECQIMEIEMKTVLDGIQTSVESLVEKQKSQQVQLDAIDVATQHKHVGDAGAPAFIEKLKESEGFQRLLHDRRGRAIITLTGKDAEQMLSRKTTLTETTQGFSVTGVMPIDRTPGITPEARQQLTVRD